MHRKTVVLAFALAAACSSDPPRIESDDAGPLDAGPAPAWQQEGCEPVPFCLSYTGTVPYCQSVHDAFGEWDAPPDLAECMHWLRCPRVGDEPCYSCRDWSSSSRLLVAPEEVVDQPACSGELCPVPDGGYVPSCDAGMPDNG